jgi:ribosome maturation factor RimP
VVEPVVEEEGFELLEMVYAGGRANAVLRLVLDHPEASVTLDDCSRVSRAVGRLLDGLDLIPGRYRLEVSSPGLDRPLRRERDFLRFQGSHIKVSLDAPLTEDPEDPRGRQKNFTGRLVAYDAAGGALLLETEAGLLRIPHDRIHRAGLLPEVAMPPKPSRRKRP